MFHAKIANVGNNNIFRAPIKLITGLLVLGVFIQSTILTLSIASDLFQISRVIGQHALWRSAFFFHGQRFADFVSFLNENIPVQTRVVLLPTTEGKNKILSITPYMQFYLSPRQVINCQDLNCLSNISPDNTYILITDPSQITSLGSFIQVEMFDSRWGVASTGQYSTSNPTPIYAYRGFGQLAEAAVLPLVWSTTIMGFGFLLVSCLLPELPLFPRSALGFGVGMFGMTWLISLLMLSGLRLVPGVVLASTVVLIVISAILFRILRHDEKTWWRKMIIDKPTLSDILWKVSIIGLTLIALAISVGKSHFTTDEILLWGAKGYGLASSGELKSVVDWGTNTVPYPLHIPLLIASFKLLFSEALPASKLVFPGYYIGLITLVYQALLQAKQKRSFARLVALLIATSPLVFHHGTIAYANLATSFYLVAASVILPWAFDAREAKRKTNLAALLSGLLFSAAAWTRPEGLPIAWAGILLVIMLKLPGQLLVKSLQKVAYLVVPVLLYTLYWSLVNSNVYQPVGITNTLVGTGLNNIIGGNLHTDEAVYLVWSFISRLTNINSWGLIGILFLMSLPFSLYFTIRGRRSECLYTSQGLIYILMILGMYFLTSYDPDHDISWWVSTGIDRMLIPGVILSLLGGLNRIDLFDDRKDSAPTTNLKYNL